MRAMSEPALGRSRTSPTASPTVACAALKLPACLHLRPRAFIQVYERVLAGESLHEQHPVIQAEARDLAWSD